MVSKARLDLPEPDRPVMTVRLSRGMSTSMPLRLCSRAPRTPAQLARMRALVRQAMKEGAMGVGSSLIYAPASYAETPELIALTSEAGNAAACTSATCATRGQAARGDRRADRDQPRSRARRPKSIISSRRAPIGARSTRRSPGRGGARARPQRITADMYTYPAGATGLDAAMPPGSRRAGSSNGSSG
jgi:N-acyl-D-amino-acid deacylase